MKSSLLFAVLLSFHRDVRMQRVRVSFLATSPEMPLVRATRWGWAEALTTPLPKASR